jgi:CheY-like chemotaxis protein
MLTLDKNIRIIILEDLASDAELIEFELADAGIAFIAKRTATRRDYMRALREFSPDLILSDYDLPQYNGSLALMAAKRICPKVPFILVTGTIDTDDQLCREIIANGASGFVLKDNLKQLAPIVLNVLTHSNVDGGARGKVGPL